MRQSIRALGWTITISLLMLFAFLATAVYSVFQTALMERGITFGEPQPIFSNNTFVLSIPITVNNTGYYDITDFNVTSRLKDKNGATLVASSTLIREIRKGSSESRFHNLSLSLAEMLSKVTYLLFNDTELKIDISIGFRYAYALALDLSVMNTSMPWGAPLHGLNLTNVEPVFNGTHLTIRIFLEFSNHSFFDIAGNLNVKIYNETKGYVGSGGGSLYVPSGSGISEPINVVIVNPQYFTRNGTVKVDLELPMFNYTLAIGEFAYG